MAKYRTSVRENWQNIERLLSEKIGKKSKVRGQRKMASNQMSSFKTKWQKNQISEIREKWPNVKSSWAEKKEKIRGLRAEKNCKNKRTVVRKTWQKMRGDDSPVVQTLP